MDRSGGCACFAAPTNDRGHALVRPAPHSCTSAALPLSLRARALRVRKGMGRVLFTRNAPRTIAADVPSSVDGQQGDALMRNAVEERSGITWPAEGVRRVPYAVYSDEAIFKQ